MDARLVVAEASTTEVFGAFIQYQTPLHDELDLVIGVRHDDYSEIGEALSPRLALIWEVHRNHILKFLYGEAFRAPTTNERLYTQNSAIAGNPALAPEQVTTTELNWLYNNEAFGLELSVYKSAIVDAINQDFIGATRTFVNSSVDETVKGIEGQATWHINTQLKVSFSATHLVDLPDSQFRQAQQFASMQINYSANTWSWNLSSVYAGEREMQVENNLVELDSYIILASRLAYKISDKQTLALNITNLLDEDYLTPSQGQTLHAGIPNRGREAYLKYSINF